MAKKIFLDNISFYSAENKRVQSDRELKGIIEELGFVEGGDDSPEYSAYIATISQSSTNNPTATVHNSGDSNFLSGITFARNGAGDYEILKNAGFPAGKVWIMYSQAAPTSAMSIIHIYRVNDNGLGFTQTALLGGSAGTGVDGFVSLAIEIRVYP
jgi:hypothetical protein